MCVCVLEERNVYKRSGGNERGRRRMEDRRRERERETNGFELLERTAVAAVAAAAGRDVS